MKKIKNFEEFSINEGFKLPDISLKISAEDVKNVVVNNVSDNLKIAKDKINDPENKKKLNTFLNNLEQFSIKIKDTLKTRKGQNRAILLSSIATYSSLFAGIWGAIFNSGFANWWNPGSFEMGGLFYLKLALFFYLIKIILKVYKNVSTLTTFLKDSKKFIIQIYNLFKSNPTDDSVVKESVNLLLIAL